MTSQADSARPGPLSSTVERIDQQTLRRRQWGVLRSVFGTLLIIVLLIGGLVANRDEVTIRGCKERMDLVRDVLQHRQSLGLPPVTMLPDPVAPYNEPAYRDAVNALRSHALYNLLYSRQVLSAGEAGVCACRYPHARLIGESGRWVIVYRRDPREYEVQWMSEADFRSRRHFLGLTETVPRSAHP
jgi:hypothetical protein